MIEKDELLIRLMNHSDLNLMVKWLNDPKVLEYYEELPSSFDQVQKKYTQRLEGKHYVTPCIVEYNNKPLGYIQYYKIPQVELRNYGYLSDRNIYGIDQFIGETKYWGKGIGTTMILLLLNHLQKQGISKVVLEVNKMNDRALKCYQKCGFRKIKEISKAHVLMEWCS